MSSDPTARGQRIRNARQLRGWSQEQLAAAVVAAGGSAGKSRIHDWETGTKPRGQSLHHLAAALSTTAEWLLSGEGPAPTAAPASTDSSAAGKATLPGLQAPTRAEFDAMAERVAAVEEWIREFDADAHSTIADLEQIADEAEGDEDPDT